jgi:hypothetical protein
MPKKIPEVKKALADLGFVRPKRDYKEAIYGNLRGKPKSGKTHFALRYLPEPITFININKGLDGVVQKFMDEKDINLLHIDITTNQAEAVRGFRAFEDAWREILSRGLAPSLVVDKMGEIYELACTAEFGYNNRPMGRAYGRLYTLLDELLDIPYQDDVKTHVILIHDRKEEYKNDEKTGEFTTDGYKRVEGKVGVNMEIEVVKNGKEFAPKLTILSNRFDLALFGKELVGKDATFEKLGETLFGPHWDPEAI